MKINPFIFLISLGIGLFIVYISQPTPEIVYKYPTPDNVNNTVYKDSAENCFKYKAKQVQCDGNEQETPVENIDLQEKENEDGITGIKKRFAKKNV